MIPVYIIHIANEQEILQTYTKPLIWKVLTHWGRVTHICVSKLAIFVSNNGLSPGRRQAIIWTNAGILLIWTLGTNFSEILSAIHAFSFTKMHLKRSFAKWRPFCLGLNVLRQHFETRKLRKKNVKHKNTTNDSLIWSSSTCVMGVSSSLVAIVTPNLRVADTPWWKKWKGLSKNMWFLYIPITVDAKPWQKVNKFCNQY